MLRRRRKGGIVKIMANSATLGFYDIPAEAIETFEKWSGLRVALHDLGRTLLPFLPPDRFLHRNPFCDLMKATGYESACYRFEVDRLRPYLQANAEGCSKVCHAGILEWSVPILDAGRLAVVLFAGLRRCRPGDAVGLTDPESSEAFKLWPAGIRKPARVTPEQSRHYLEGLRHLAARLRLWMEERKRLTREGSAAGRAKRMDTRAHTVQRFIAERFRDPVALADLAGALHLSRSRTAHLVAEVCGRRFGEQLREMRLRHAAGMIRQSDCTIAEAALDSGFGDVSNFHKAFRRHFGLTPLQYRRRGRTKGSDRRTPQPLP